MEPPTLNAEQPLQTVEMIERMLTLGLRIPFEELLFDYPYPVVLIDRWGDDIFMVLARMDMELFRIIQLPRSYHESFIRFLTVIKNNNVDDLYLEYLGSVNEEEPILRLSGGGFSTYMA